MPEIEQECTTIQFGDYSHKHASNLAMIQKQFRVNFGSFSTRESKKILEEYKNSTGRLVNERQLLKQQELSMKQRLELLLDNIQKSNYTEALKIALMIHDKQPILPSVISYLALYLSIHDPDTFQSNFQDMDPVSTFIESAILINPMRSSLYFMKCATLENPLDIRKQLESGMKLEDSESEWIWNAWRYGALLSYQAQEWEEVLCWSTKAIQVLKKNQRTRDNIDKESVYGDRSNTSISSEVAALNIESYFTSRHVVENILEASQFEDLNQVMAEMLFYRGCALQELGYEEESRKNFDLALEVYPNFGDPYNDAALQSESYGDWNSALDAYHILLKIEPNNFQYLYRAACASFQKMGVVENEEEVISLGNQSVILFSSAIEAIQLNPDAGKELNVSEDQIYVNRSLALSSIKEIQKAIADYTTAISINDENRDALRGRANLFIMRGDINDAVKDYEALIELFDETDFVKENATIYQFLAEQAYKSNHKIKAAKYYIDSYKCGSVNTTATSQVFEIATSCAEDFLSRQEDDPPNILQGTTLTSLCLLKLDGEYSEYFGPFSSRVHDFRKVMSDNYFTKWKTAALEAKDPKKKKK